MRWSCHWSLVLYFLVLDFLIHGFWEIQGSLVLFSWSMGLRGFLDLTMIVKTPYDYRFAHKILDLIVKTKDRMWLKIQVKPIYFCFFHFIPEIIRNTPIFLQESWSFKLQGRKKVLRHKALSPDPEGSYLYIYIECGGLPPFIWECGGLWPLSHLIEVFPLYLSWVTIRS